MLDRKINTIVRSASFLEKVVIVDGHPGCGKSLLSAVVASYDRVEKLNIAYETEFMCALNVLGRLDDDVARTLIRLFNDLMIYDLMMCRETNIRFSDVSSIFHYPRPWRYLKRLFLKGDHAVPERIAREKPILHLCTHDLLCRSGPVFGGLGNKVVFIEVVRHPLYIIKQAAMNMDYLHGNPKHFEIYYQYGSHEIPYYARGWEEMYLKANPVERAIYLIESMTNHTECFKKELAEAGTGLGQIITIPFERFVIEPWDFLRRMEETLETTQTFRTKKVLRKQNVPRDMYAQGIGLSVYKRCGWEPPRPGATENDEFAARRAYANEHASPRAMDVLDRICTTYEEKYLGGKQDYH